MNSEKVLVDACHQAVIWQASGFEDVLMCVNVSRLQAQDPDFAGQVADALNTTGLSGKYLELELTSRYSPKIWIGSAKI